MSQFKLTIGIYGLENLYGGDPWKLIEVAQKEPKRRPLTNFSDVWQK